ncbi:hypothetical protein Tco_1365654 [Tanacetum coccineum]
MRKASVASSSGTSAKSTPSTLGHILGIILKTSAFDHQTLCGREFIRICDSLNLLDGVPELLHKDFWDICRDSESLKACRVLDHINHDLKCLFLMWYSGFQSDIGRANLNSLGERDPLFITSNNLLVFLRIHDSP